MELIEPNAHAYYVEDRPHEPQPTLRDARIRAAWHQLRGDRRTLAIYHQGEVIDIKRY